MAVAPESRATVVISAHYVPARIPFLATVLKAILGWKMATVKVALVSNDPTIMGESAIVAAQQDFASRQWSLNLELTSDLAHPFHLTWRHKQMIPPWISTARQKDDYFIYLEDDMVLTNTNIEYFSKFLAPLRRSGLIPSFLRFELRDAAKYSVDMTEPQLVSIYPTNTVQGVKFVCPTNPYWAAFILDKGLAQEYVRSKSFDLVGSEQQSKWDVRERAAMGLTWEAVPNRYKSRYVVPLIDGRPSDDCLVWHCAQNYNTMSGTQFATLPIEKVFVEGDVGMLVARAVRKAGRILNI
jgi:hypothetical protein